MKYALLLALALGGPAWGWLRHVHERNAAVAAGAAAYTRGDTGRAAAAFGAALAAPGRGVAEPTLLLDLAHAQVRAGQLAPAQATYGRLLAGGPAVVGSVARQQLAVLAAQRGEVAQALGLLRQALLIDPRNQGARFDYEVLSDYVAQRPHGPTIAPPPTPPAAAKPSPEKNSADRTQPANKAGTDRPGEINAPPPTPPPPASGAARRGDPAGQPDNHHPAAGAGTAAGGRAPGAGVPQPLASGGAPGTERGLDRGSAAPGTAANGRSTRPGTDAATPADVRLQTQRERLQAMNLSPAQARQLLETLRAQEQQYLQQLTRPASQRPDPTKPTW